MSAKKIVKKLTKKTVKLKNPTKVKDPFDCDLPEPVKAVDLKAVDLKAVDQDCCGIAIQSEYSRGYQAGRKEALHDNPLVRIQASLTSDKNELKNLERILLGYEEELILIRASKEKLLTQISVNETRLKRIINE